MSDEAKEDFDNYIDYILYQCDAPLTAAKHKSGMIDTLKSLEVNPLIYAIKYDFSLLQYGLNVRRVNFKKMAILFTVIDNTVFVHRILSGSMITGLN